MQAILKLKVKPTVNHQDLQLLKVRQVLQKLQHTG